MEGGGERRDEAGSRHGGGGPRRSWRGKGDMDMTYVKFPKNTLDIFTRKNMYY